MDFLAKRSFKALIDEASQGKEHSILIESLREEKSGLESTPRTTGSRMT